MDISEYLSLEFLIVILSVIFIISLTKILITIARRSKVGFMISIGIVCIIIILVIFFTVSYNTRYSLEGEDYIYGRITSITSSKTFVVNSTKGTYKSGTIGSLTVKINKDTKVYSNNLFENIKDVKVNDFVLVVCSDEQIEGNQVNAIKVIRSN